MSVPPTPHPLHSTPMLGMKKELSFTVPVLQGYPSEP